MLIRDVGEHLRRHALADQLRQRPSIGEALGRARKLENVAGAHGRVALAELRVVFGPGKRIGRHQRAGAHASDGGELRPRAGLRPAIEKARAVGALFAAGRQDEPRPRLRRKRPLEIGSRIRPKPRVRHARHLGHGRFRLSEFRPGELWRLLGRRRRNRLLARARPHGSPGCGALRRRFFVLIGVGQLVGSGRRHADDDRGECRGGDEKSCSQCAHSLKFLPRRRSYLRPSPAIDTHGQSRQAAAWFRQCRKARHSLPANASAMKPCINA